MVMNSLKRTGNLFLLSILKNHNKYMSAMEEQKMRLVGFPSDISSSDTIPSFLLKTYEILENEKYCEIICWTKNGEGFIVKKVKQFAENVLPIFFRHSNYTSFVRQLNMYDFHKTRQENHQNAFKNIMFKRGFKHLLKDIQRKDYKKNKENTKESGSNQKSMVERSKEGNKNEKNYDTITDSNQISLNKVKDLNAELEKKAIFVASIKEMPEEEIDVIRLLDILFDARKLQREILQKLCSLQTHSAEGRKSNRSLSLKLELFPEKQSPKHECPTAQGKTSMFQLVKDDRIPTYSTLFSSFRQG